MKRFLKLTSLMSVLLLMIIVMTGCSKYNFYNDFKDAGAKIEKDNIFEVISLEEIQSKKEAGETFVVLYGSSSSTKCVNVVTSLQTQAEYLGNEDATIYFFNSKEYNTTSKVREVKEAIKMHNPSKDGSPIIITFKAKAVDIDTSNTDKVKTKEFIVNGEIQYASLASEIFKNILN